jgi:hypothetical protein
MRCDRRGGRMFEEEVDPARLGLQLTCCIGLF